MAGFNLFNLFKRAPDRQASDQPPSAYAQNMGGSARGIVTYENAIAGDIAMQHPIVFRCLYKIATSVGSVDWYCEQDPDVPASERAGAETIKAINRVLTSPSDNFTDEMLRYWMALNYALFGRVPFVVGVGVSGATGIYPVAAKAVKEVIDNRGYIREYKYGSGENEVTYPIRKYAPPLKNFMHEIYTPNVEATIENGKNITPLKSIGLPSKVTTLLLQRAIDTASGHPNNKYIVAVEKLLTEKQKTDIRGQVEDSTPGGEKSGNILFLYNTPGFKVHELDNNLSDIHSKMPMDDMTRLIAGAFGIPISLLGLGAADGAKFAGNYSESRRTFWEDTIIPGYLSPIAKGLTAAICPPGARIVFDYDTISAIGDIRASKAKTLETITFLTDDEKRELTGYPPLTESQKAEIAAKLPKPPVAEDKSTPNPDDET